MKLSKKRSSHVKRSHKRSPVKRVKHSHVKRSHKRSL